MAAGAWTAKELVLELTPRDPEPAPQPVGFVADLSIATDLDTEKTRVFNVARLATPAPHEREPAEPEHSRSLGGLPILLDGEIDSCFVDRGSGRFATWWVVHR